MSNKRIMDILNGTCDLCGSMFFGSASGGVYYPDHDLTVCRNCFDKNWEVMNAALHNIEAKKRAEFTEQANKDKAEYDLVNHPSHYCREGQQCEQIECLDAIEASMSPAEFKGYLKGNALKYLWRYDLKGKPTQDLAKCIFYLDRLHDYVDVEQSCEEE